MGGPTTRLTGEQRARRRSHEQFLTSGSAPTRVRPVVAASWMRSSAAGVDPESQLAPVVLSGAALEDYRAAHPLAAVYPLLYDVLGRAAVDCECVMAVGDDHGRLLWVSGSPGVLRRAEAIHFVEGSAWDEPHAGTNAPGTALHLDRAVQIGTAEHFTRPVQPWSCAAAPIHDPRTTRILGVLDVTGGVDVGSPQTLAMIRAAARMAESELARIAAEVGEPPVATPLSAAGWSATRPVRVRALGRSVCVVELAGRSHELSRRHSELLVALVERPEGSSAEELECEVYAGRAHSSTVRAEMTRLRTLLDSEAGEPVIRSRPYRLVAETECDWTAVEAQLAAGQVRDALRTYRGPLLPHSDSPLVTARREELEQSVRAAVLASGEADLMVAWTRSRWGADDLAMWRAQADALPAGSPLAAQTAAHATRLDGRLGSTPG